jgi:stearoyl-CoA desaturase (Delta-9 desaturase)
MFNISTAFIDLFAWCGWATELKTVPDSLIKSRILRTGDGSHVYSDGNKKRNDDNNNNENESVRDVEHFWGFGDKEMTLQDMKNVKIL